MARNRLSNIRNRMNKGQKTSVKNLRQQRNVGNNNVNWHGHDNRDLYPGLPITEDGPRGVGGGKRTGGGHSPQAVINCSALQCPPGTVSYRTLCSAHPEGPFGGQDQYEGQSGWNYMYHCCQCRDRMIFKKGGRVNRKRMKKGGRVKRRTNRRR